MTAKIYTLTFDPEIPIGGVFHFEKQKQLYKVEKSEPADTCSKCAFHNDPGTPDSIAWGNAKKCCRFHCNGDSRKDGFDVHAVKVKAERGKK